MAKISVPVKISGLSLLRNAIERHRNHHEFKKMASEDYKEGVNTCFDVILSIINRLEGEVETEQVNHPVHYNTPGRKECIEEMIDRWGPETVATWCEITAYKYEYRAGLKDGNSDEQDTAKRQWYLDKAKELRKKES